MSVNNNSNDGHRALHSPLANAGKREAKQASKLAGSRRPASTVIFAHTLGVGWAALSVALARSLSSIGVTVSKTPTSSSSLSLTGGNCSPPTKTNEGFDWRDVSSDVSEMA